MTEATCEHEPTHEELVAGLRKLRTCEAVIQWVIAGQRNLRQAWYEYGHEDDLRYFAGDLLGLRAIADNALEAVCRAYVKSSTSPAARVWPSVDFVREHIPYELVREAFNRRMEHE